MTSVPLQVQFDPASARFGASRSQKRLEDDRLLAGKGLFSDDREFPRPGVAGARALAACAREDREGRPVGSKEGKRASSPPGRWPSCARDGVGHIPFPPLFKRADGSPMAAPLRTPLAEGKVYYVGQPVVAVVARDARCRRRTRPSSPSSNTRSCRRVVDAQAAIAPGAPLVWAEASGNIAAEARYGDAGAGRRSVRQLRRTSPSSSCTTSASSPWRWSRAPASACFESGAHHALHAEPDADRGARAAGRGVQAQARGIPRRRRRHRRRLRHEDRPHAGGRAGVLRRAQARPPGALARRAQRGVPRRAHGARPARQGEPRARSRRTHPRASHARRSRNIGAVPVGSSAIIPLQLGAEGADHGLSRAASCTTACSAVLTNTMATGAYRGAGRPEANYLMERLIEKAAREMKLDPVELRRRNFIRPSEFPYRTHLGDTYDGGDFGAHARAGARRTRTGTAFRRGKKRSQSAGKLRGRGLSVYLEWTGAIPDRDGRHRGRRRRDGHRVLRHAGDGAGARDHLHAARQRGARRAVRRRCRIVQGDTDRANGVGSVGSRSAFVGGSAVVAAGRKMIVDGPESSPPKRSRRRRRTSSIATAACASPAPIARSALGELAGAAAASACIRVSATETPSTPSWPNGAQVVRGRDRSRDRRGGARRASRAATTSAASSTTRSSKARSMAASRRAPARRCSSRRSTTRTAASFCHRLAHGLLRAARRPSCRRCAPSSTRACRARPTCWA